MHITEINLICSDVGRSKRFYESVGFTFRPGDDPDAFGPCMTTGPGANLSLHTADFARWWDPSHPGVAAGSSEIDLTVEAGPEALDALVARLDNDGATVVKAPADMPWGQRFAIVLDPDGHRIGLKSSVATEVDAGPRHQ